MSLPTDGRLTAFDSPPAGCCLTPAISLAKLTIGDYTAKWIDSESATIRPEGVLSEVYAPEATREELAAAVGQVLDILSDDEEEDE